MKKDFFFVFFGCGRKKNWFSTTQTNDYIFGQHGRPIVWTRLQKSIIKVFGGLNKYPPKNKFTRVSRCNLFKQILLFQAKVLTLQHNASRTCNFWVGVFQGECTTASWGSKSRCDQKRISQATKQRTPNQRKFRRLKKARVSYRARVS